MTKKMFIGFIMLIAILTVFYYKPPTKQSPQVSLTGVLRQMNITPSEKEAAFLTYGIYQLTLLNKADLGKLPFKATSLLLEGYKQDLSSLIGKCVTVTGNFDTAWIEKTAPQRQPDTLFAFDGAVFIPTKFTQFAFSQCDGYKDISKEPDTPETYIPRGLIQEGPKTHVGTIKRFARVVPDVGPYDYSFSFETPYTSTTNAAGLPMELNSMNVTPSNNQIWEQMESYINKKVVIKTYELWGYAESHYLLIMEVEPSAD